MDPNNQGSEEYGHDADGTTPRQRPPRDALTSDFGQHTPALARTVQLVSGDYLLTINPVDGSEIEVCPPGERPGRPVKLTAAERAEITRAARPSVPPGPPQPELPLLERDGERERLVRLLARGRSVRLTGPAGSGRTTLLDAVAADCADLAPDGVVRLTGFHRTQSDLLYDLFYAVYSAPLYRPEPDELHALVREVGAVVVLDDVEFGGAALDELLDATPECAFLISATPDVPAPSADSLIEEQFLDGLDRAGGLELLERAVGRVLTEEESNWAGDLWFESEGLPLRFVQAGALLRQRDGLRARADAFDEFGVFEDTPVDAPFETGAEDDVPLPSLAEGAAPAPLLASRLSTSARETLRFAVALGGEVPHQAHLPALVDDAHADAALGELLGCALVSPVGSHYRLAAGVQTQLEAAGYGDGAQDRAFTAAQHYAWWAGHPSVAPERVCAESDALLAALAVLVPATTPPGEDEESTAVQLARTAAPAFAAGLYWSAWERVLLCGAEAARLSGEVAEQAYFHHELGILALCGEQLDMARTELEAALGLRGAVADKRGTVAGRRALTLVADRAGDTPGLGSGPVSTAGEEVPDARYEESASPPGGVPAVFGAAGYPPLKPSPAGSGSASGTGSGSGYGAGDFAPTVIASRSGGGGAHKVSGIQRLVGGARRNLVAAGAGALLAAVLGTVVTLGATSNPNDAPSDQVGVNPSASAGTDDDSLGADKADNGGSGGSDSNGDTGTATSRPTDPGPDGTMGTSDDPTPPPTGGGEEPSDEPSGTKTTPGGGGGTGGGGGGGTATSSPTDRPTTTPPTDDPTTTPPTDDPTTTPPTDDPTTTPPTDGPTTSPEPSTTPDTTTTASGPASSPVQTETASEPASAPAADTSAPVI
ncbi:ATP-binding protein [Streptomyces sp. NBC_00576]|uniref:ATP-binding protein n=1 Tax=Streptomyces sp. NBC_00576 TaxID=2903665 RepID=UPI002E8130EC|nr:ATP-binding protein [Streptomyces sp. NBC_00576]WUB71026.1 ATP-binding protein [Streptomyces sp. NBC_00576]